MIHDIDIILNVVHSPVKNIYATGVGVVSKEPDVINARIEFDNGCIANLTASKINPENEHKINFYQKDNFINVDYLNKTSTVHDLGRKIKKKKSNSLLNNIFSFDSQEKNETVNEFSAFAEAIQNNPSGISMANCLTALEIAYEINAKVNSSFDY